jgi:hypothetical protein
LAKIAENWQKSSKIGKNRRKLAKIAENWQKSPKIGKNRRKLAKIAENCDHNIDPRRIEVFVMTVGDYLRQFWPDLSAAHDVYESLQAVHTEKMADGDRKSGREQVQRSTMSQHSLRESAQLSSFELFL